MKKLLSIICSILCIHSFSQFVSDSEIYSEKASGEKMIMRAMAGIVNPQGNKKTAEKTTNLCPDECPL